MTRTKTPSRYKVAAKRVTRVDISGNEFDWLRGALQRWGLGPPHSHAASLQSLWAGYGHILRIDLQPPSKSCSATGGASSTSTSSSSSSSSVIAKVVHPTRRVSSAAEVVSDTRKRKSYDVEIAFYLNYANANSIADAPTAVCYHAAKNDTGWNFLFEDLGTRGYVPVTGRIKPADIRACLRWLAAFHARFMGVEADDLWAKGTYWHLDTRQEELRKLSSDWQTLAVDLDQKLSGCRFKTIVHGDAKIDNFLISTAGGAAAVDFQYIGSGCGMKDVVYFLSSCMTEDECDTSATIYLDSYFELLLQYLQADRDWTAEQTEAVELEWRGLVCVAWSDYQRFLLGWDADHPKINRYSDKMTVQARATLLVQHDYP